MDVAGLIFEPHPPNFGNQTQWQVQRHYTNSMRQSSIHSAVISDHCARQELYYCVKLNRIFSPATYLAGTIETENCTIEFIGSTIQCISTDKRTEIRQSTIYYAGLLGRWDKRIINQESDVPIIIFSYFL